MEGVPREHRERTGEHWGNTRGVLRRSKRGVVLDPWRALFGYTYSAIAAPSNHPVLLPGLACYCLNTLAIIIPLSSFALYTILDLYNLRGIRHLKHIAEIVRGSCHLVLLCA